MRSSDKLAKAPLFLLRTDQSRPSLESPKPSTHVLTYFSPVRLCDPMDCSPPGSSVHGILQARIHEWIAMPSSRASFRPRNQTPVSYASCMASRVFLSFFLTTSTTLHLQTPVKASRRSCHTFCPHCASAAWCGLAECWAPPPGPVRSRLLSQLRHGLLIADSSSSTFSAPLQKNLTKRVLHFSSYI